MKVNGSVVPGAAESTALLEKLDANGEFYVGITMQSGAKDGTAELAANITADLASSHIRKNAEYVGAFVCRFYSIDKLVSKLFEMDWVKAVGDTEKPAVCVVRN